MLRDLELDSVCSGVLNMEEVGIGDHTALGAHSRLATMDGSYRMAGDADGLVCSKRGSKVLIRRHIRQFRLCACA